MFSLSPLEHKQVNKPVESFATSPVTKGAIIIDYINTKEDVIQATNEVDAKSAADSDRFPEISLT